MFARRMEARKLALQCRELADSKKAKTLLSLISGTFHPSRTTFVSRLGRATRTSGPLSMRFEKSWRKTAG